MYLTPWMIALIVMTFGVCAYISRRQGFFSGATQTLMMLEENRFIKIEEDGSIKRWTPHGEPLKKKRTKKAVK